MEYPTFGEADPGGLGACPQQNSTYSYFFLYSTSSHLLLYSTSSHFLLFQKRSKSVSSASQKVMVYPTLGEADPGGLGACPQQISTLSHFLLYSKLSRFLLFQKRSKSVSSASQKVSWPRTGRSPPRVSNWPRSTLLFPEKEAKSVILFRRSSTCLMDKPFLLFQKRSKSVSSTSQKKMDCANLGEADPGGLGAVHGFSDKKLKRSYRAS
jgi:hypothetical protein